MMKHTLKQPLKKESAGFTLLEVMVVIAIMGLIVSVVQFNFSVKRPDDILQKASYQFSEHFESAANYGLLNNVELGLYLTENSYRFLGFDGVKWSEVPEQEWLGEQVLPENVIATLALDDLPIETPLLFDSSVFKAQDEEYLSFDAREAAEKAKKEKQLIPQVYILSGGDITPFSLTFSFTEEASLYEDLSGLAYRVTGIYSTPLTLEELTLDEE